MSDLPFDIIIPSKGRSDGATFQLLERVKLPYTVIVERADSERYKHALPCANILTLPKSNQGIGYSRKYVLKRATRPFVMMDDDISKLYSHHKTAGSMSAISIRRFLTRGWARFQRLQQQTKRFAMLGFKNGSFAIPQVSVTHKTTIAHIIFIDPAILSAAGVTYDASLKAFEDIDILFQCAKRKIQFARMNHLVYYTTPSGTATHGGVEYNGNTKERFLNLMVKRYPGWIVNDNTVRESDNQPMYHIDWKNIAT